MSPRSHVNSICRCQGWNRTLLHSMAEQERNLLVWQKSHPQSMVVGVHELFQSQALGKPAGMHSSLGGARVSTPQHACSRNLACYNNALTSEYTDTDRKDRWNQVATHHGEQRGVERGREVCAGRRPGEVERCGSRSYRALIASARVAKLICSTRVSRVHVGQLLFLTTATILGYLLKH